MEGAKTIVERKLSKLEEQGRQETKEEVRREKKKREEMQREKEAKVQEVASLQATVQNMEAYRVSSDERLKSAEAEIKVSRSVLSFALKDTRSTIYCVSRCCDNTGRLNRFMYKMFNWVQVKIHKSIIGTGIDHCRVYNSSVVILRYNSDDWLIFLISFAESQSRKGKAARRPWRDLQGQGRQRTATPGWLRLSLFTFNVDGSWGTVFSFQSIRAEAKALREKVETQQSINDDVTRELQQTNKQWVLTLST